MSKYADLYLLPIAELKTIFADPDLAAAAPEKVPFDYKPMVYAGFKILVDR